jgi:hypothetical protein
MSFEQEDPIPPGFYWLDFTRETPEAEAAARQEFAWWVRSFDPRRVRTVKSEGAWVLFEVEKHAMRWSPSAGLGFPNRAPQGAATTARGIKTGVVSTRPDPEKDILEKADDALGSLGSMGGGLMLLLGLYFLSKGK